MPAIVTPVQRPTQGRKLLWGPEVVAVGTAPTGVTGQPIFVQPIGDFDVADQREIYDATEYTGAMTDRIGQDELTHYTQATLRNPFQSHGIMGRFMAQMMGNQAYAPTPLGAGIFQHLIPQAPFTNRINTNSCWWQTTVDQDGAGFLVKQYTGVTPVSLAMTFGAGSALNVEAGAWTRWHTFTPPPAGYTAMSRLQTGSTAGSLILAAGAGTQFAIGATPNVTVQGLTGVGTVTAIVADTVTVTGLTGTPIIGALVTQTVTATGLIYIGSDATYAITRTMGYQGTFSFMNSSGVQYTPRILSGTVTLSRPADPVFASDSQTIIDIALGPLSMSGNVVFQFDGFQSGTVARDASDFKPAGSFASPSSLRFTDADGSYFQIDSGPWKWHPFTLDYSGQFVKGNGTFTAQNDPTQVMTATPKLSVVKNLTMVNKITTAMVLP